MTTFSVKKLFSAAVLVSACSFANAATTVITFDEEQIDGEVVTLQHGTVISNQYSDLGVSISTWNANGANIGALYNTTPGTTSDDKNNDRDSDLTGPEWGNSNFSSDGYNAGNTLIIQENSTGCDDGVCDNPDDQVGRSSDGLAGTITFNLDFEINQLGFDLIDFQSDLTAKEVANSRVFLYNDALEKQTFKFSDFTSAPNSAVFGENSINRVYLDSFNIAGVNKVKFKIVGTGALDNLLLVSPSSQIPEPSTIALFGLALLGLRRATRKV